MSLKDLRDILLEVTANTFHYSAEGQEGNYIVWAEEGQGEVTTADDKVQYQDLIGYIMYYTHDEFDENFDLIQTKLNDAEGVGWSLESVVYDEEEDYIIFLWNFSLTNVFE